MYLFKDICVGGVVLENTFKAVIFLFVQRVCGGISETLSMECLAATNCIYVLE